MTVPASLLALAAWSARAVAWLQARPLVREAAGVALVAALLRFDTRGRRYRN